MNAHLQACVDVYDEQCAATIDFLRPLDEDCLNWRPPAPGETNSIAAMVAHVAGSMNSWLARAVGETAERNRDAEFGARATAQQLIDVVERSRDEVRRRIGLLEGRDLSPTIRVRRASGREMEISLAWCLEHALIHAGEHWGQIQLTKQLYDARRS